MYSPNEDVFRYYSSPYVAGNLPTLAVIGDKSTPKPPTIHGPPTNKTKCKWKPGKGWVVDVKDRHGLFMYSRGCPNPWSYPRPYDKSKDGGRLYEQRRLTKYLPQYLYNKQEDRVAQLGPPPEARKYPTAGPELGHNRGGRRGPNPLQTRNLLNPSL